jgi:amino acid transporter
MFGTILIVVSGISYKLIYRTKLRDPATVDLQTGRRPLSVEEIIELDNYKQLSAWRRFYSFVQLW